MIDGLQTEIVVLVSIVVIILIPIILIAKRNVLLSVFKSMIK